MQSQIKYPRIKINLFPYVKDHETIRFGGEQKGIAREIKSIQINVVWDLIKKLDGKTSIDALADYAEKSAGLSYESFHELINFLKSKGCLEEAEDDFQSIFTLEEIDLYQRNIFLYSWLDNSDRVNHWEIQAKLKNAKVVIIGLGGVGSSCASALARLGVGNIRIVDFDKVEPSNLNRQTLFDSSDIGKYKVDIVTNKLQMINKYINIEPVNKRIASVQDIIDICEAMDLVILCADEPKYKIDRLVNRAIHITKTPWIQGSYAATVTNYSLTLPGQMPCFECLDLYRLEKERYRKGLNACSEFGSRNAVTAPIAGLTGNFAAQEAMMFLTGLKSPLAPTIFQLDLMTMESRNFERKYHANCSVCKDPYKLLDIEIIEEIEV